MSLLGALLPFVTTKRGRRAVQGCELCGAVLEPDHPHLADVEKRSLACACRACGLLFTGAGSRWRKVPDRHLADPAFRLLDEEWDALGIPVSVAFFFKSTAAAGWTAVYPSPAGPVESLLRLEAWSAITARTTLAAAIEPDVEALLVNGGRDRAYECILVPIHACYALVGHVRGRWRGLDGGDEARAAIAEYLATLRKRCDAIESAS